MPKLIHTYFLPLPRPAGERGKNGGRTAPFALTEVADAEAYLEADKHVGKVVIQIWKKVNIT